MALIKTLFLTNRKFSFEERAHLSTEARKAGIEIILTDSLTGLRKHDFEILLLEEKLAALIKKSQLNLAKVLLLTQANADQEKVYQRARQLGAFSLIPFPLNRERLFKSIKAAYAELLAEKKKKLGQVKEGKILLVTSFKGGLGKSLISLNLAQNLSRHIRDFQLLLVDFSSPFGAAKALANLDSEFSWSTIRPLLKEKKALSRKRLFGVLGFAPAGFALLASPSEFGDNQPLGEEEFRNLLEALREYFQLTILDFNSLEQEEDLERISQADHILLVLSPDPCAVFNTHQGLEYLRKKRPEILKKMLFVVNRLESRGPVSRALLEEKLKIKTLGKIEEDSEAVTLYLAKAQPFADKSLIITQDCQNLAEELFKKIF